MTARTVEAGVSPAFLLIVFLLPTRLPPQHKSADLLATKFLKARIAVKRIKVCVEPKKRGSERDVAPSGIVG